MNQKMVEFELREWCVEGAIPRIELVNHDGMAFLRSQIANEYRFRLAYSVYAKTKTTHVEYPADWWEAVKARWFPKRWLKRWPVRLTRAELSVEALLPEVAPLAEQYRIYYGCSRK